MRAFCLRQACEATAIELDAITIRRDVTVLGRGEIDVTIRLIDALDRAHFPFAVCDLSQQFSIGRVVIEMLPTVALAGPDERAVFEPDRLFVDRDPRLRRLVNNVARFAVT